MRYDAKLDQICTVCIVVFQDCNLNCTAIARYANTHLCELYCNCCSKLLPVVGCLVGASKVDAPKGGLGFICFAKSKLCPSTV